jgi:Mg/Co/Ni transporter MgtE
MGVLVGLLAFILSGFNTILATAILLAQSTSATASGLTGSVMPVLLESLLGHQAPKWSGLMVTAIQDVLSTFAMVFITVKLLTLFGVSSSDSEGACHLSKP